MRAIWATPARLQLAEAIEYVAESDPLTAILLDEDVDRTVCRLVRFPYSAKIGRLRGTREAIIGSYILVYEVHPDYLLITHFIHCSRQFPPDSE